MTDKTSVMDKDPEMAINNVLCYVSTARHSLRKDDIIRVCLSFFKDDEIITAKDTVYKIYGEEPKRRRHKNRMLNETQDLLDILEKCDEKGLAIPKYVADAYDSLPPTSGFEVIAQSITTLLDEISSLKKEISSLKESRMKENLLCQDNNVIKEDLITIKGEVRKLNHKLLGTELRRNSLILNSLDKSMQQAKETYNAENWKIPENSNGMNKASLECTSVEEDAIEDRQSFQDERQTNNMTMDERLDTVLMRSFQDEGGTPSAPTFSQVLQEGGGANLSRNAFMIDSVSSVIPGFNTEFHANNNIVNEFQNDDVRKYNISKSKSPARPEARTMTQEKSGNVNRTENGVDSDGYQVVRNRRKKHFGVVGLKKTTQREGLEFRGAKRSADLFVGNCELSVTEDRLTMYMKDELGVDIDKCELLPTRSENSRAFKVTLNLNDRLKLLNPELWPEDVVCRKFFNPRKPRE